VNPALRVAIAAIIAAAFATVLFPIYLSVRANGSKVFEPHPFDFALVAIATFALAVGVLLVPWRTATKVGALGVLVGGGLLFGALAIFSIGVVIIPLAAVLLVVLARVVDRAPLPSAPRAALGGAVIGYGLVLLFIALIIPPTVECLPNGGASTSSQRWDQSGGGFTTTSTSTSTADGIQAGRIESQSSVASYRCEQGRIVEFHREAR
jgi:hypothetical protein